MRKREKGDKDKVCSFILALTGVNMSLCLSFASLVEAKPLLQSHIFV